LNGGVYFCRIKRVGTILLPAQITEESRQNYPKERANRARKCKQCKVCNGKNLRQNAKVLIDKHHGTRFPS